MGLASVDRVKCFKNTTGAEIPAETVGILPGGLRGALPLGVVVQQFMESCRSLFRVAYWRIGSAFPVNLGHGAAV